MIRDFNFEWSCDYEDDSTFFTHINDIPEDEPCALHSCLTAVADLFERPLYGGPKDPEFEKTIPEGCDFPPIHEDDCRRYAEEHHLIFELTMDDDFNCIAVYIDAPTEFIGVCSDREVELYEEDKAKKEAFVDSVLSKLEEQAGQAVTMSQDELVCELIKAQDEASDLEEKLFNVELRQDELVAKLAKTQDENEGLKNDIKDLAYSYEELREVNAKLRDERRDLSFENATLKNDIENLQQENFELSSALEATEQALDDALRQVAGFKASDAYFKSRIEEIEHLKRDNSDMGMQVLRANIRAQAIADSYEKLKADTCDYEYLLKENEKLIKANTKLAKENEEYRCENVLLQHHVESISSQIAELEKEVHRVTKIIKANKHSA